MLRGRWKKDPYPFIQACENGEIVLLSYCSKEKKGKKCHRYLLVEVLLKVAESIGIEAKYNGEVMTYSNNPNKHSQRRKSAKRKHNVRR